MECWQRLAVCLRRADCRPIASTTFYSLLREEPAAATAAAPSFPFYDCSTLKMMMTPLLMSAFAEEDVIHCAFFLMANCKLNYDLEMESFPGNKQIVSKVSNFKLQPFCKKKRISFGCQIF